MGLVVKYVQADPKTGRLIYRRAFPADLRPYMESNRRELKVPLGAKSVTSAIAMRRYREANARFDREVVKARAAFRIGQKEEAETFDALTLTQIEFLASALIHDLRMGMEQRLTEGHAPLAGEAWSWLLPQLRKARLSADRALLEDIFGPTVERLVAAEGLRFDPKDAEGRENLMWALSAKIVAAGDDIISHLEGYAPPIPAKPERPAKPKAENATAPETFEAIVESLLASPGRPISPTTKEATRTALRFFRETHGTPTPSGITRAMVADWMELLAQRPSKLPRSEADLPLPEIVKLYAERSEVPRLSPKTLLQHLSMLSARWTQASKRGRVDRDAPNPFRDHDIQRPSKRREPKGFNAAELGSIFSLPVFTAGERPRGGKGEASYWLPLLLLFTGARPEEIAQLIVSDFTQDSDGQWLLTITDEGAHPHKAERSLKTDDVGAGPRTFPVPHALLDLGLLAYRKSLLRAGELALFPKLRIKGARGHLYPGLGEWWSKYLKLNNVVLEGDQRQPMRELRHTWSTAARRAGVPREVMAYIQGHSLADAMAGDDYGDRSPLGRAIDSLVFEGLHLGEIRVWAPSN